MVPSDKQRGRRRRHRGGGESGARRPWLEEKRRLIDQKGNGER